jgi:hypothetical protein
VLLGALARLGVPFIQRFPTLATPLGSVNSFSRFFLKKILLYSEIPCYKPLLGNTFLSDNGDGCVDRKENL